MKNNTVRMIGVKDRDGSLSYKGKFHCWSINYEEFNDGIGNYPCAIIEKDDGSIEIEDAASVQFLDRGEK